MSRMIDLDDPRVVHLLCNLEPRWKPMDEVNGEDFKELNSIIGEFERFSVDAEPVRHGHWVAKKVMARTPFAINHYCSKCKFETDFCTNYCSNCGAKMDEEAEHEAD